MRPYLESIWDIFHRWNKDYRLSRKLPFVLSSAAIISGILSYFVMAGGVSANERSSWALPLVYLDVTLLLLLTVVIARRIAEIWVERKKGMAGSKLHVHIVVVFAIVAAVPAICVVIFSAIFLNLGVDVWFGGPVREAISESKVVAEAYYKEHKNNIIQNAKDICLQLRPSMIQLINEPVHLSEILSTQMRFRDLKEALIFNGERKVIARAFLTFALEFEKIPFTAFEDAKRENVAILSNDGSDRVRALIQLDPETDTYLYIGKFVDKSVLQHVTLAQGAAASYDKLEQERSQIQISFLLFFALGAILLVMAAIWIGLTLANLLVRPIGKLIHAAEEVSQGNLSIEVTFDPLNNEIDNLGYAFNQMINQLYHQREDLIVANNMLDRRRLFTERVLSGVSAGIVGLDEKRCINLPNAHANELLMCDLYEAKGENFDALAPEFSPLIDAASKSSEPQFHSQITLMRRGVVRILHACVVVEREQKDIKGYILTFDDVTALISAQRKATWSDLARKIAHEIKNPLTPIQLSAERLKRKYLSQIENDPQTFQKCVDTIIRQVGHIGRLVSEFSAFARMPDPVMKQENIIEITQQVIFLLKQAHLEVKWKIDIPPSDFIFICDAQQMTQVLTNLIQNAINAITENDIVDPAVHITIEEQETSFVISIEDNGPGFPLEGRERLTEPYFTTRAKGTGLGLAIVAKIIEDHQGRLSLGDSELGGAKVTMTFQKEQIV